MIKGTLTIEEAVELLNEMARLDPKATERLISQRIACNEALAKHPTVQVHDGKGGNSVGMLGVVNGMFGVDDEGWGAVAAVYEVICPNDHETPKGSTIRDKCQICEMSLVLGGLVRFERTDYIISKTD